MRKLTSLYLSVCIAIFGFLGLQIAVADKLPLQPDAPKAEAVKAQYPSFADIVEPLIPAVVNVYTTKYNKQSGNPQKSPFPDSFPFDQFNEFFDKFNAPLNNDETYSNSKAMSLGSGFIIDPAGFIVTNHHVINNADEIHVKLLDNTELPAKLIGSDQKTDLALLKVDVKAPLPYVKFGDSSRARVGDWIIAIGNPFGLGGTVTTGIVSSKGRDLDLDAGNVVDNFIQTDAAINSGNSGGPLFNIDGEIIGVNTVIFSPSGLNVGVGFAIPSNTASAVIDQLKKNGKIMRGRLDIYIQEVTTGISEGLDLKEPVGALVRDVVPGGAGEKAGLKAGDVIIKFADQQVKNSRKLQILVAESPVGKDVKIMVMRGGKEVELTAKIVENKKDEQALESSPLPSSAAAEEGSLKKNNITFSNLTEAHKERYNLKSADVGVVITALTKDQRNFSLNVGDLVIAANQVPIKSVEDLNKIYESTKVAKKKNIVLFLKRQSTNIFLALPVE
jgi:serine protease Do